MAALAFSSAVGVGVQKASPDISHDSNANNSKYNNNNNE